MENDIFRAFSIHYFCHSLLKFWITFHFVWTSGQGRIKLLLIVIILLRLHMLKVKLLWDLIRYFFEILWFFSFKYVWVIWDMRLNRIDSFIIEVGRTDILIFYFFEVLEDGIHLLKHFTLHKLKRTLYRSTLVWIIFLRYGGTHSITVYPSQLLS